MKLIIVYEGKDRRLLQVNLAGRTLAEHLSENLPPSASFDIFAAESDNNGPAQFKKVDGEFSVAEDILIIGSDAWFSRLALERLLHAISSRDKAFEIRSVSDSSETLAIYIPGSIASKVGIAETSAFRDGLAGFRTRIPASDSINGHDLDPELPPVRIRNFIDVAALEQKILYQRACAAMLGGVRIRDPRQVFIRGELRSGEGVEIDIDVIIEGRVNLGDGVKIGAHSILSNATIDAHTRVNPFSIIEDAVIGSKSIVGPYGRVRPGSIIANSVQIGSFVEIKNSSIGLGSRINHLAFIGDATIQKEVTIGAGCITCNHSHKGVSHTEIGAGAYIGSGSQLVAPLTIGENATIGAGSTITEDAPAGKLTLARSRQCIVENWPRK